MMKRGVSILSVLAFVLPAFGISEDAFAEQRSIYVEKVEEATILPDDLTDSKKKVEDWKEIEIIDDLPLPAYHKRTPRVKAEKEPVCALCHKSPPHTKSENARSFLNMHTEFISCEVCHYDRGDTSYENLWISYQDKTVTGLESAVQSDNSVTMKSVPLGEESQTYGQSSMRNLGMKISLYQDEEPVMIYSDNPFIVEVKKTWESSNSLEKAYLRAKLHKPLTKKGAKCGECHDRKQKKLDLKQLKYSEEQIKKIERNRISRFIDTYEERKKKIRLTELFD